jgi:hypothetical protein
MSNTDPNKKPVVNPSPASYKTPAVLLIHTGKPGKSIGSDRGKKTSTQKVKDPSPWSTCTMSQRSRICLLGVSNFPLFLLFLFWMLELFREWYFFFIILNLLPNNIIIE